MNPTISVVSPVYKAETIVSTLVARISKAVSAITDNYEIILVEDGSPDNSWTSIVTECQKDIKVRGIRLSKNFGQHAAITAGLHHATGDWIVVMDCDLQDVPEEIPKLYKKAIEGFDLVLALRANRRDRLIKKLFSKLFYSLLTYLTGSQQDPRIANFGIYHKQCIEGVLSMEEPFKFFPVMIRWVGFKQTAIEVQHAERIEGQTSYNFHKLLNLAINLATSYSDKPLRLTVKIGMLISLFSFGIGFMYLYKFFSGQIVVLGYASLMVSVWFLSGLIIFVLGIVGLYIANTFETTKKRPIFLIRTKIN